MESKPRIVHLIQSLDNGGCENMLLRTLPLLSHFEHHIVTLSHSGSLLPYFQEAGCCHMYRTESFLDYKSYFRLAQEITHIKPV
jgi:hypothetical protein